MQWQSKSYSLLLSSGSHSSHFNVTFTCVLSSLDVSLRVDLNSDGYNAMYQHYWNLSSPPFVNNTWTCLNLKLTPYAYMLILLTCVDLRGKYQEKTLYRYLPDTFQKSDSILVQLNLDETASRYAQCSVLISISSSQSGKLIVMDSISLLSGHCKTPKPGTPIHTQLSNGGLFMVLL